MKLFLFLINLSLASLPLSSEQEIQETANQAGIENQLKIDKIRYSSNENKIKTELTAPQLNVDPDLEKFYISNPSFSITEENNYKTINASAASFNKKNNLIEFENNVQIKISSNSQSILLDTTKLILNKDDDLVTAKTNTYFKSNNFNINSRELIIRDFSTDQNQSVFVDGKIINPVTREKLGSANKINYSLDSGTLIMKGSAVIKNKALSVYADEIHYDPDNKKIIKSVNSTIINNSQ
jgi:LPS export ABC transporter protein LptC